HCPIPPVYGGRFFAVPRSVVLEDIRQLVVAGAGHITFGDPDFLNGPGHALKLVRELHVEFPDVSYDFTAKIEHVRRHRELFAEFAATGCAFVVSAVETLSDVVLAHLEKGHTKADVAEAIAILRHAGIAPRPTFVPVTRGRRARGSRRHVSPHPGAREPRRRDNPPASAAPGAGSGAPDRAPAYRAMVLLSGAHRGPGRPCGAGGRRLGLRALSAC